MLASKTFLTKCLYAYVFLLPHFIAATAFGEIVYGWLDPDSSCLLRQHHKIYFMVMHWSHVMRKPVLPHANNKGADQPAHPHSQISAFVIRCLDGIIPLVSISKISSL